MDNIVEEATGLKQNGPLGKLYNSNEEVIECGNDVFCALQQGEEIEAPNAGAGSYNTFFKDCAGFDKVKVIDWTSSAGDWCFGVFIGGTWFRAWQHNRYPYHGFKYNVDFNHSFKTFEETYD